MIRTKDLVVKFKDNDISIENLEFEKGKSYVILGASGCGKSTLLNIIGGQLKASVGSLSVDGVDLYKLSAKDVQKYKRSKVAYITQDSKLFDNLTVNDNLGLKAQLNKERYNSKDGKLAIGKVGLGSDKLFRRVRTLSGGERQRVSIAQALVSKSQILLCDEPTGALNSELAHSVMQLLVKVHKELDNTLIVVTHDDRLTKYFDVVINANECISNNMRIVEGV